MNASVAPSGTPTLRAAELPSGCSLIELHGAVERSDAWGLERVVIDHLVAGRRRFVLDLRGVTRVGAGLLGAVLRILRGLGGVGGLLVLVGSEDGLAELTGVRALRMLSDVVETPQEAVSLLERRAAPVLSR